MVKMLGVGMAVAILLDATVVRMVLVPGDHVAARPLELVDARLARPGRCPASAPRSPTTTSAELAPATRADRRRAPARSDAPTRERRPTMTHRRTTPPGPTQIRLPGQTAAHPGPVDMTMMYVMHHAFRRDLARSPRRRGSTPVERPASLAGAGGALGALLLRAAPPPQRRGRRPLAGAARAGPTTRAGRRWRRWRPSTPRSTRSWRRAPPGSPGSPSHADEDARAALAVRLVAARESLGRAPPARGDRGDRADPGAAHPGGVGGDREGALQRRASASATCSRWCRGCCTGCPAPIRRELFAKTGGAMHRVMWLLTRRGLRPARGDRVPLRPTLGAQKP